MRRSRRRRRLALVALGVVGGLYWAASTPLDASAEVTNDGLNCKAAIGTFDVGALDSEDDTKAVHVSKDGAVTVSMRADRVIARYTVNVAFTFRGWEAAAGTGTHSEWSSTVGVDKYARFGVGLYRVVATSFGSDGTSSCTAAALVFVDADPIPGTVAGDLGAAFMGVAFMGLTGSVVGAGSGDGTGGEAKKRGELSGEAGIPTGLLPADDGWCYPGMVMPMLLTILLMVLGPGGGGVPAGPSPAAPGPRLRRARWRPHLALIPIASGMLGAIGALVLLQQYGKLFPTLRVVIVALAAGVLVGIALPSLAMVLPVRRYNRRVDALEAAQAEAAQP